jgi:hypothetical protein
MISHRTIKIVTTVIVLMVFILLAVFFFTRNKGNALQKVPKQAVSVVVINVPSLSAKLFLSEISSDTRISARIAKLVPDSLKEINWTDNGLGLFDKLVLFTLEDTTTSAISTNFIIKVSSAGKFNAFMKNLGDKLHFSIIKFGKANLTFIKSLDLYIAWNSEFVTGMKTSENNDKNAERLLETLSTPKQQSIITDTCFAAKLAGSYDILIYTKPYTKCPVKQLEIVNAGMRNMTSYLSFNKGLLEINTILQQKPGSTLDKIFPDIHQEMGRLINTDSSIINIDMHVNAEAFKQFYSSLKFFGFDHKTWYAAWDGNLNLAYQGNKDIKTEYVTYSFDDNFNKIEKKEIKKDKVFNLQALAGMNPVAIDSQFRISPPFKKDKDTLLMKSSNFIVTKTKEQFLIYNGYFTKPRIEKREVNENIKMEIAYLGMVQELNDMGFNTNKYHLNNVSCKTIYLRANKSHQINLLAKFVFADKEKNSLYHFLEIAEQAGSKKIRF